MLKQSFRLLSKMTMPLSLRQKLSSVQSLQTKPTRPLSKLAAFILLTAPAAAPAQTPAPANSVFIHPGGLHTKAELDRMKEKVAAKEHPWIDSWNLLIKDRQAQPTWHSNAKPNMGDGGAGRVRSDADAHAAYFNFLRWYISGDRACADCAIRICNDWSAVVNQDPPGGLSGIFTGDFAIVGELLRCCPYWKAEDQERFKKMMRNYLYPHVKAYLDHHNQTGDSLAWANWDICNIEAMIAIGVFLDDRQIFDEGIEYFKHGRGTGSIQNAVYFIHPGGLGQWQESGRDQGHAQLGLGMMSYLCEIAFHQGVDLFGYDNNRLLAGAEYVGATALLENLPFKYYDNDAGAKNYWASVNGYGRLSSPVWELLYNHYVVRRGLKAPNIGALAKLTRPEGKGQDQFGFGTLTFTLDAAASPYPALPLPAAPTGLAASPGLGRVYLNWHNPQTHDASGYIVRRARAGSESYETIANWNNNIANRYIDDKAEPGVTYQYVVAAHNPAGVGADSQPVTGKAEPSEPLPQGWAISFIGDRTKYPTEKIQANYSEPGNRSFHVIGVGRDISGNQDSTTFAGREVHGDCTLVGRMILSPQESFPASYAPKMGLMIRESLEAGSRCAALSLGDVGLRATRVRFRAETNGKPTTSRGNDYSWMPIWYKLERKGNAFTASHSMDGKNWIEVGSSIIPMPEKAVVGFFATGSDHSKTGRVEVIFDNASLTLSNP